MIASLVWRVWARARRARRGRRFVRGTRVLGVVVWAVLATQLLASSAAAGFHTPLLDNVASRFAQRDVQILCKSSEEDLRLTAPHGVWGFVMFATPTRAASHATVWDEACIGALAIDDDLDVTTDYMKFMGVAVVTHEAFHMKLVPGNGDEGVTDCRAMRHYEKALRILGAEQSTIDRLMPKLMAHYWEHKVRLSEYLYKNCRVPESYAQYLGDPPE